MTDRTMLLAIADQVETLTAPDREMDALVYQALYRATIAAGRIDEVRS